MKRFARIALGTLMMAGATTVAATASAEAQASVDVGGPAYGGGYYGDRGAYCDRRNRWQNPYRCEGNYDSYDSGYGDPYHVGYYSPRIYFGSLDGDYGGYDGGFRSGFGGGFGGMFGGGFVGGFGGGSHL